MSNNDKWSVNIQEHNTLNVKVVSVKRKKQNLTFARNQQILVKMVINSFPSVDSWFNVVSEVDQTAVKPASAAVKLHLRFEFN